MELTPDSVIDGRLYSFLDLPLPIRFLHLHQIELAGDRKKECEQLARDCYASAQTGKLRPLNCISCRS